jgi:predicted outer membrane protein
MKSDGAALAAKIAVVPKSPADSAIVAANDSTAAHLKSASKGMPFDTTYANAQVGGHQMALDFLRRASSQAQNPDLKKAVTDAIPVVQGHLDMATALQTKLK